MGNPWLGISEADYVGHMSSPAVNQYPVLSELLREALDAALPHDVLILGCSTGNGLEHVDPAITRRVSGVDVNPLFLQRVVEQFPNPGFELDVRCADLADYTFEPEVFDLVHAGLVLEYLEWPPLLPSLVKTLRPRGTFSVVLQRSSAVTPAVTPTEFTSLRALESLFRFVDSDALVAQACALGLELQCRRTEPLRSAKAFEVLRFAKGCPTSGCTRWRGGRSSWVRSGTQPRRG